MAEIAPGRKSASSMPWRVLSSRIDLPPDTLQEALSAWGEQLSAAPQPVPQPPAPSVPAVLAPVPAVAMDGKEIRGAWKQTEQGRRLMVAAAQQGSGHVLGQVETESKSNEIPAVRRLARSLRLAGKVVTMDAPSTPSTIRRAACCRSALRTIS